MKQAHIHCEAVSEHVILVGDPARVRRISEFLDNSVQLAYNREYLSVQGIYKSTPITVISTGIGAPSALICIEELIWCGAKNMIRVGSTGTYQPNIKLGELIIVEGAVRQDGGSQAYIDSSYPAVSDFELVAKIKNIAQQKKYQYYCGLIRSHDSFYTDQEDTICSFWSSKGILGADMETSALLTLARLRGVRAASILNNVVEYQADLNNSILDFSVSESRTKQGELDSITLALETLADF
ncbi:MAG: nucleoside phosphorylase [Brevinemataceae bacterium]